MPADIASAVAIFVKCVVAVTLSSHRHAFSVSDLCPKRRHSPTLDHTITHKSTDAKLQNIMIFSPSQKRVSSEMLASIKYPASG